MFNPNVVVKNIVNQPTIHALILVIARTLLAYIFIVSGWGKITGYAGTAGYMESMGVSSALLPLVIFVEFGGGLAILFGLQTRLAAFGIGVFSILAAFLFHGSAEDAVLFMKNLALAGGFFALMLHGAGAWSIDKILEKNP